MKKVRKLRRGRSMAYWAGRRASHIALPEGWARCAITGKILPVEQLERSFPDWLLTPEEKQRSDILWCEDADWLSDEGCELALQSLEAAGIDIWARL